MAYFPPISSSEHIIATSTVAASLVLPGSVEEKYDYWLVVTGVGAYVNLNGTATSANTFYPAGLVQGIQLPGGLTVSAITAAGTGQVALVLAQ